MNISESHLYAHLQTLKRNGKVIHLSLHPQGDNTTIEPEPINLCKIETHGKKYTYGGISEPVYDWLVERFHHKP